MDWISVKDRLPENEMVVLVFNEILDYDIGKYITENCDDPHWITSSEDWMPPDHVVTHWMPLPKSPKE